MWHLKCSYPASSPRPKVTTIKISSNTGAVISSNLHGLRKENTGCRRKELENVPSTYLAFMALNCSRTSPGKCSYWSTFSQFSWVYGIT